MDNHVLKPLRYLNVVKGKYINRPTISIKNGIIKDITNNASSIKQYREDSTLEGLDTVTLLPGLIDTHVHISYHFPWETSTEDNHIKTLEAGFTTVRDLGSEEVIQRYEFGPNVIEAGRPIFVKDLKQRSIKDNLKQRSKSDVIKIFESKHNLIPAAELQEIVNEAKVPVAIHAIFPEEIEQASLSGCRTIEHCSYPNDKFKFNKDTYICATFSNPSQYLENFDNYRYMFKDRYAETKKYFEDIRQHNVTNIDRLLRKYPKQKLVFGTDSVAGMHGNNQYEFSFLEELNMKPIDCIRTATVDAAEMLYRPELGQIAIDCDADIVGVVGDPLKNIDDLLNIVFVMKNGIIFVNDIK